jgi:hypothetical protein
MSARILGPLAAAGLVAAFAMHGATARQVPAPVAPAKPAMATSLKKASDFAGIADPKARSLALFSEVGKVLQHPRCLNCHPATERPTQTDAMTPHMPLVVRAEGMGAPGLHCFTCHHEKNYDPANVPGNPKWMLAPAEMAWQGRTLGQICAQLKDKERNGGKTMAEMEEHMAKDELVGWGWHPGGNRTPVPGTQMQFGELFTAWVQSGAHCPA